MDASPPPTDPALSLPATRLRGLSGSLGSVRSLMMASGLAFILVVNGLIGYGILQRRTEALDAGERATRDLARMLEAQALRTVFAVDQLLADLSFALNTHPEGRTRGSKAIHEHLRQRRDAFPQLADLVAVGGDGFALHHSAEAPLPGFPLDDRDYFTVQRDAGGRAGLHVGTLMASRVVLGTQVLPFSRPWPLPAGADGSSGFGGLSSRWSIRRGWRRRWNRCGSTARAASPWRWPMAPSCWNAPGPNGGRRWSACPTGRRWRRR